MSSAKLERNGWHELKKPVTCCVFKGRKNWLTWGPTVAPCCSLGWGCGWCRQRRRRGRWPGSRRARRSATRRPGCSPRWCWVAVAAGPGPASAPSHPDGTTLVCWTGCWDHCNNTGNGSVTVLCMVNSDAAFNRCWTRDKVISSSGQITRSIQSSSWTGHWKLLQSILKALDCWPFLFLFG